MNHFGGNWTQQKIEIVVDYAKAYLTIMNKFPHFNTLYFDGFAGSGDIFREDDIDIDILTGTAIRILEIGTPRPFDMYYFVEKNEKNKRDLEATVKEKFPNKVKSCSIAHADCNEKLVSMTSFLRTHQNYSVLAFIDPYGMSLNWSSIEALKGFRIDLWVLVPTGIGVNRLLKKDYNISEAWLLKLEKFLGLERDKILTYFYKKTSRLDLFGEETMIQKEKDAIEKAGSLYKERLNDVFNYVSDPFIMRNSTGSIMYHFMMASNNKTAHKIANDIIKPKYK